MLAFFFTLIIIQIHQVCHNNGANRCYFQSLGNTSILVILIYAFFLGTQIVRTSSILQRSKINTKVAIDNIAAAKLGVVMIVE